VTWEGAAWSMNPRLPALLEGMRKGQRSDAEDGRSRDATPVDERA